MTNEAILERFKQVVAKDLKHEHYNHVNAKRKLYRQLVAGVGLDDLLRQYVRRENADLFKQRVNLTQHIVTSVCATLLDVFYKIPRSNSGRRVLTYQGKSADMEAKTERLEGQLKTFWGTDSWDDWMATRFVELNSTDPNGFTAIEFEDFDAAVEAVSPYPFEVTSEQAVDYAYDNKVLQYLIVKLPHKFTKNGQPENYISEGLAKTLNITYDSGFKYTLYGKERHYQYIQFDPTGVTTVGEDQEGVYFRAAINGRSFTAVKLGDKYYEYKVIPPHGCGAVPAFCVGYYRDPATDGATYVNQLHKAEPYLLKSITLNSHLDLVAALLAFPQQIKYGAKCEDEKCYAGYYKNGSTCTTCKGTAVKPTAPSAQDAIVFQMPKDKEQLVPLDDLIKYIHAPIDIIKWQDEFIDKLEHKAKKAMFLSDSFSKGAVQETATGKALDMTNVYDTLFPFASRWAKVWGFGTTIIAKLSDLEDGLVSRYTFGRDFKLKTLDTLILNAKDAADIGSSVLSREVSDDIAIIMYSEKPMELLKYRVKLLFEPFAGKNDREIALLMAGPYVPKYDKVLYANFSRIFDELEMDSVGGKVNFYKLKRDKQQAAVDTKVKDIIATIDAENPAPTLDLGE